MRVKISFAGVVELEYDVMFMQACINDIVDDMMLSNYLFTRSWSSHLQYVMLQRFLSRNGEVLPTMERLKIVYEGCKELEVLRLEFTMLCSDENEVLIQMIEAVHYS